MRRAVVAAAALLVVLILLEACGADSGPARKVVNEPAAAGGSQKLRFAVIGDFGTGGSIQAQVARRMCRWRRSHSFDLVVTTGDNVYDHGAPRRFGEAFFEPYECLLSNGVRFRASLGNHDIDTRNGRPELAEPAFGMKSRNYVVRNSGVRFVVVNSNSLKRRWLRRALKAEPSDRWTIVVFHHPVFSPGTGHGSTPGFRPSLPRLFRYRGVDLVLNGHDHIYSVSRSLRKIRYVVTGGGGAELYGCDRRWFTARCVARHHFLYVTAGEERIRVRAVPRFGRVFDRFRTIGRS